MENSQRRYLKLIFGDFCRNFTDRSREGVEFRKGILSKGDSVRSRETAWHLQRTEVGVSIRCADHEGETAVRGKAVRE